MDLSSILLESIGEARKIRVGSTVRFSAAPMHGGKRVGVLTRQFKNGRLSVLAPVRKGVYRVFRPHLNDVEPCEALQEVLLVLYCENCGWENDYLSTDEFPPPKRAGDLPPCPECGKVTHLKRESVEVPSYMDIGHGLNRTKGQIWFWDNGKLDIAPPTVHSHGSYKDRRGNYWRGRFDPGSKEISVVPPEEIYYSKERIRTPPDLLTALTNQWPGSKIHLYTGPYSGN